MRKFTCQNSLRCIWSAALKCQVVCIVALLCCCAPERSGEESWKTGIPSTLPPPQNLVDARLVYRVPTTNLPYAVALLVATSSIELSLVDARQLLGHPDLDPDAVLELIAVEAERKGLAAGAVSARRLKTTLHPVLVRCVSADPRWATCTVQSQDDTLWVITECLGKRETPLKQTPIVVFLARTPRKVYVDAGIGE